jgi:hypothetical protein
MLLAGEELCFFLGFIVRLRLEKSMLVSFEFSHIVIALEDQVIKRGGK